MQRLKIIFYPDEDHWERLVLPDGKNLGYVEAKILSEICKKGPIYVSNLRRPGLDFNQQQIKSLILKGMVEREETHYTVNYKRVVSTSYGMNVISELRNGGLLKGFDRNETS